MYVLALLFFSVGVGHFVNPQFFESIVPAFLPYPSALQYIAGAAEIAGAVGLLVPKTRRWAAWGLVALLVAVFPANIDMALNPRPWPAAPSFMGLDEPDVVGLYLRLPMQAVLLLWAWWYTRP